MADFIRVDAHAHLYRTPEEGYAEKTGYEVPEDLTFKKSRLEKITAAKDALEAREKALYPNKAIDDKKQISFADPDARIMGKKGGEFTYNYNPRATSEACHF